MTTAQEAGAAATRAAEVAGCRVAELVTVPEQRTLVEVLDTIWAQPGGSLLPANLVRALQHTGGYVVGAFAGDRIVGGTVGFLGRADGRLLLHSHVTGIAASARGRGVGVALKLHQRAWCLERAIGEVTWTFDPLVRTNAVFNLRRLGAAAVAYLPDHYGPMPDAINAGDPTDRLGVRWTLTDPRVVAAAAGQVTPWPGADTAPVLVDRDADGRPRLLGDHRGGEPVLRCRVPHDVLHLRRTDPGAAAAWRTVVREALGGAIAGGYVARDAAPDGWYTLARQDAP